MARDRLFFFISFAILGLAAAYLFRDDGPPTIKPVEQQVEKVKKKEIREIEALSPSSDKIAVPLYLTVRSGIVQFMSLGMFVDIIFISKPEKGFGTVSLTLLKHVRVLGIGKDSSGRMHSEKGSFYKSNSPIEILLEMTPREAEIFSYAQESGTIALAITENDEGEVQQIEAIKPPEENQSMDEPDQVEKSDQTKEDETNVGSQVEKLFRSNNTKGISIEAIGQPNYFQDPIKMAGIKTYNPKKWHFNLIEAGEQQIAADEFPEWQFDSTKDKSHIVDNEKIEEEGDQLDIDDRLVPNPSESEDSLEKEDAALDIDDTGLSPIQPQSVEEPDELVQKLLESDSDESFNSVLVTHMIQSLLPNTNIKITVTAKGYIVTGKVPNQKVADNVLDILDMLVAGSNKTIVNLLEVGSEPLEATDTIKQLETKETEKEFFESFSIEHDKRAVPLELNTRSPIIPFLKPRMDVDIKFTSKPEMGFDTVNVTLFRNIRILSILGKIDGKNFDGKTSFYQPNSKIDVFLEMTPRQAEIFAFAENSGEVSLELIEANPVEGNPVLVQNLLESQSLVDFHSILITHMLQAVFPSVNVKVGATHEGWIIEGKVPDPQIAAKIVEIIDRLIPGGDRPIVNLMDIDPQQVLLAVTVFEVFKDIRQRVGLNWQALFDNAGASIAFAAVFPRPATTDPNYFVNAQGIELGRVTLSAIVDMLEENGCGRVLAKPNLTTVSGETAVFFAGGEFPILIPQGGTLAGTVTVEYKKFGVILEFTPFVDLNGSMTLHVIPEVSNIDESISVVLAGFRIPGLLMRRVDTKVKLWPGQSYLIGGLYLEQRLKNVDGLYGLNRLPLVGPLFESKNCQTRKTELMVMVTPYLISDKRRGEVMEYRRAEVDINQCSQYCEVTKPPLSCRRAKVKGLRHRLRQMRGHRRRRRMGRFKR